MAENDVVFIAGSRSIAELPPAFASRIAALVASGASFVIGDAEGIDTAAQDRLRMLGARRVVVYHSGEAPRRNAGGWECRSVEVKVKAGTWRYHAKKDVAMTDAATRGLFLWDLRSSGTLANMWRMVRAGKPCDVLVAGDADCLSVHDTAAIRSLEERMPAERRAVVARKLGGIRKSTNPDQPSLF